MAFFRPNCLAIAAYNGNPHNPPRCINDPTQEISSTVNGPVDNGLSFDSSVRSAGDSQPILQPIDNEAKLAIVFWIQNNNPNVH